MCSTTPTREWVDPVDPNTLPPVIEIIDHFNPPDRGKRRI
jgi:hypothetical protein